jgi:hypothetical protein
VAKTAKRKPTGFLGCEMAFVIALICFVYRLKPEARDLNGIWLLSIYLMFQYGDNNLR